MLEQALEMELEERGHGDADTLAGLSRGLMQVEEEDRIRTYIHTHIRTFIHTYRHTYIHAYLLAGM